MQVVEERILGFDVRECRQSPIDAWSAERRALYLLRKDVERPLSVDGMVWRSAFDIREIDRSKWIAPNLPLWNDLGRLESHFAANRALVSCPSAMVAVTWFSEGGLGQAGSSGPHAEPTQPGVRDRSWDLIGFDVADAGLISGLTNCGFLAEESAAMSADWGPRLNDHHLFAYLDAAMNFRQASDTRVPDHAPFFVYGLYFIKKL